MLTTKKGHQHFRQQ